MLEYKWWVIRQGKIIAYSPTDLRGEKNKRCLLQEASRIQIAIRFYGTKTRRLPIIKLF